jgi:hypothetical protein
MRASNHAIARTASTQIDQYAANLLSELTANTARRSGGYRVPHAR